MRRPTTAISLGTHRTIGCIVALACFLPAAIAHADDATPAKPPAPHLVHVGDRVCLVYETPDGTLMARCRKKHGTWADAAPPVPASYSGPGGNLVLHATKAAITRRAEALGRGRACLYLSGGTLILAGALMAVLGLDPPFCSGDPGCVANGQVAVAFGIVGVSIGLVLMVEATRVSLQWDVDASGLHVSRVGW